MCQVLDAIKKSVQDKTDFHAWITPKNTGQELYFVGNARDLGNLLDQRGECVVVINEFPNEYELSLEKIAR